MKLYYSPGACSLASHIALHESGLPFQAIAAPTKTHRLPDGTDYYAINPLGYVPLLELDDGTRLAEGAAILQYIADQVPGKQLIPAAGTWERYKVQEWLNFVGTELHKGFSPLFNPATPEDFKPVIRNRLIDRFKFVNESLAGKAYLSGDAFCVADAYLFTVSRWAGFVGVSLEGLDHLAAFMARMNERPAVQAVLRAEGFLK